MVRYGMKLKKIHFNLKIMKATELMIGDWVEVTQNSEKHFSQIQMIDGYGDNATSNYDIQPNN